MIKIIDNLLPKSLETEIYNTCMGPNIPWYYNEETVDPGSHIGSDFTKDRGQLVHLACWPKDGQYSLSNMWPIVKPIVFLLEKEMNISITEIERCKINLLTPNGEVDKILPPHTDGYSDRLSLLYYVNDSDGDTIFFHENVEDTSETLNIMKLVTPKKGKVVVFNADRYHCSYNPVVSERRIVINITFKPD